MSMIDRCLRKRNLRFLSPKLTLPFLICALLNGTEQVTIQTLSEAETAQLEKARQDLNDAEAALKAAELARDKAAADLFDAETQITKRFGDTTQNVCTEGAPIHSVNVELRGKYAVITESDQNCSMSRGQPVKIQGVSGIVQFN